MEQPKLSYHFIHKSLVETRTWDMFTIMKSTVKRDALEINSKKAKIESSLPNFTNYVKILQNWYSKCASKHMNE